MGAVKVRVVPHDPRWPARYEEEADRIRAILGDQLTAIHHIGSTAVPGLWAKPILDILPVVHRIGQVDALFPRFEAMGYECMGEFGIPGRRYFRKGGEERTHHVHIFDEQHEEDIVRHLAVRDYLRTHPADANAYGQLKRELAVRYPLDWEAYCDITGCKEIKKTVKHHHRGSGSYRTCHFYFEFMDKGGKKHKFQYEQQIHSYEVIVLKEHIEAAKDRQ